jgi:hypothetical protein
MLGAGQIEVFGGSFVPVTTRNEIQPPSARSEASMRVSAEYQAGGT